jgi:uncharacterized protein (TIGR04255 family)
MSKLPKAPLIEIIFELSWIANTSKEYEKFQFLLGDIYTKLKPEYPLRINLFQIPVAGVEIPPEIFNNKPLYRFLKAENSYPIYQIGPGLLSVNTIDNVYVWEDFEKEILNVFARFKESYDFNSTSPFNVALKYMDFYPFDFANNAYDFLKENLHLQISHSMQSNDSNPNLFAFATGRTNEIGQFNFVINKGNVNSKGEGFLVETNLSTEMKLNSNVDISPWLNKAHKFLSDSFKEMTKGNMYDSFLN